MKMRIGLIFALMFGSINIYAETLKDIVISTLDTSPTVIERLKNYRGSRATIEYAEAGYYPTLDLKLSSGYKQVGKLNDQVLEDSYDIFQNSLTLRQNIFNGFSTHEQVTYQKMRTLAAAYSYLEKANDVALQVATVYVEVQKNIALLKNAKVNVSNNQEIYNKVKKAYKAGINTMSEVSKIHASLSLAKSNMMVQQNRLRNAKYNFRKVVGRNVNFNKLKKVKFGSKLPSSQKKAEVYALEYNPSLVVGKYNIKGEEALYRESRAAFLPKVDLEISQSYNKNYSTYAQDDDRLQAMLVVSYNLYNGGADEATRRIKLSKLGQEVSVVNDLRRQVIENVDLSWGAYLLAKEQMPFLRDYKKHSMETLNFYTKEYELGARSMLDLISAENDLKRSNDEIITANHNLLIAKYRIMDSIGLSIVSILGEEKVYYAKVGMGIGTNYAHEDGSYGDIVDAMKADPAHRDTLPMVRDKDRDRIVDTRDSSSNSRKKVSVSHSGERL